jgi:uncharacterized protein YndB with AHSA1/START domain
MIDPKLDLSFERIVDVSPELVWKAWTQAEHLVNWFTPAPWKTVKAEVDLRPGGKFLTIMRSPEGQEFPNVGCYLEIVPNRKLVWTGALEPGYRPKRDAASQPFLFTAIIELEPVEGGTQYRATVMHSDEEGCKKHDAMGFETGWGKALDQLVEHMKSV